MLKKEEGAKFENELKGTPAGWQASYRVISANLEQVESPGPRVFANKSDAVAWLMAERIAHGFPVWGGDIKADTDIAIYFGAPTYQDEPEGRARKAELESEFGQTGEEASIGTGAEGPGLVFLVDITDLVWKYGLPVWGALTLGKDIAETISFYLEAAKRLVKYVTGHYTYLERGDAYILAVDAIVKHLGRTPKSLIVDGYMIGDYAGGGCGDMVELTEIGEPPRHTGAYVPHHFQFKVDGKKRLKAIVDVDGVKVIELPPAKKVRKAK